MAAKYIELQQAAKQLGVSPDKLNDLAWAARSTGSGMGPRGSSRRMNCRNTWRTMESPCVRGGTTCRSATSRIWAPPNTSSSDLQLDLEAGDEASSPTAIGGLGDFEDLGARR